MGDKELWAAYLNLAYNDAIGKLMLRGSRNATERSRFLEERKRIIEDARIWINNDSHELCSFLWVCGVLSLASGPIRKKVNTVIPIFYGDDLTNSQIRRRANEL